MGETVAVIAMGEMGSGVARRLHERGATVLTSLAGRSAASAARAQKAGAISVSTDDELVARADFILSIVPPGEAVALARRLAPAIKQAARKTIYVDCNAVSPQTADKIGEALKDTGCIYVDAGIIGPPPGPNSRTIFYASGPGAKELERLMARQLRRHRHDPHAGVSKREDGGKADVLRADDQRATPQRHSLQHELLQRGRGHDALRP